MQTFQKKAYLDGSVVSSDVLSGQLGLQLLVHFVARVRQFVGGEHLKKEYRLKNRSCIIIFELNI